MRTVRHRSRGRNVLFSVNEEGGFQNRREQAVSQGHMLEKLGRMSRPLIWAVQAGIFAVSGIGAFLLRFDLSIPAKETAHLAYALAIWIVVKSIAFRIARLDRGWWRFMSLSDLPRLAIGNLLGTSLGALAILWIAPRGFPRSIYVLDLLVCSLLTSGVRLATRILVEASKFRAPMEKKRILIYGAGEAGVSLVTEIRHNSSLPYQVAGFIDDNSRKVGQAIHGVKVLSDGGNLTTVVGKHRVDTVLIAIPSASGIQMTQILSRCQQSGVCYKTVPSLAEVINGNGLAKKIRDVAVEDLLGRNPTRLDEEAIIGKLEGKVVVVTGAGGSIGSELCRQIAHFNPRAIVGYEISENALFHLDLEMKGRFPRVPFHPEVGSIQNPQRVGEVLQRYRPSVLYHAAAYKHVPMMEAQVFEALENNVFGTYTMALAAAEHGLDDFVMISTDKAVRPTSIMGVTKRLAELAVNSLQNGRTRFVSVRFGNVLGSNGSVIPLFKKQIESGGPVTVTHPDMQRYFMTIPEASQLVLQASTLGTGGEVFVLDMGEPVKIVDLARNLILLSGLRPDEDIRIEFTGIRPGEKLCEELRTFEESTSPTRHDKVKIFIGPSFADKEMKAHIVALRQTCAARDVAQLILQWKEIVSEYNPSSHVLRRVLSERSLPEGKRVHALVASEVDSSRLQPGTQVGTR
jgi:FlaA1/EpsC-like NDP-sugar epimerase